MGGRIPRGLQAQEGITAPVAQGSGDPEAHRPHAEDRDDGGRGAGPGGVAGLAPLRMATFHELTRRLVRRWNRQARFYDLLTVPMERMLGFARARAWLFERAAKGLVLEVGAGTGKNLPGPDTLIRNSQGPAMGRRTLPV